MSGRVALIEFFIDPWWTLLLFSQSCGLLGANRGGCYAGCGEAGCDLPWASHAAAATESGGVERR